MFFQKGTDMNIPCFYITIVVDKVNNGVVAFPKIIESVIVCEQDTKYIVQSSKTNGHLRTIKKEWVFFYESSAKAFLVDNKAIQDACEDAKWWLTNYLKKNSK